MSFSPVPALFPARHGFPPHAILASPHACRGGQLLLLPAPSFLERSFVSYRSWAALGPLGLRSWIHLRLCVPGGMCMHMSPAYAHKGGWGGGWSGS